MRSLFLALAALGALVLVVQIVLGFIGFDHDVDVDADAGVGGSPFEAGLELLSVRALAAGAAFYGVGGLAGLSIGLPAPLAAGAAVLPGGLAVLGTAIVMRQMLRLESDGSLRLEGAVGAAGTVYLTIPGDGEGAGRIQFPLQGRTVELRALTRESAPIPTGSPVIVVAVVDDDTVEVVPTSIVGEILHVDG